MVLCMSWSDPKSPFVDMSCAAACIVTCHQNSTCRHPQCFEYTYQSTPRSHRAHPGACACAPGRLCPNLQSFSRSHFPCTHTTEEISTHIITHAWLRGRSFIRRPCKPALLPHRSTGRESPPRIQIRAMTRRRIAPAKQD